jgi:hypothetical protein
VLTTSIIGTLIALKSRIVGGAMPYLEKAGIHIGSLGDAGEMLDDQAKVAYRRRLSELREELEGLGGVALLGLRRDGMPGGRAPPALMEATRSGMPLRRAGG